VAGPRAWRQLGGEAVESQIRSSGMSDLRPAGNRVIVIVEKQGKWFGLSLYKFALRPRRPALSAHHSAVVDALAMKRTPSSRCARRCRQGRGG